MTGWSREVTGGCVTVITPLPNLSENVLRLTSACVCVCVCVGMDELHSLDPRRQELLEARFIGAVSGNTGGSTGSASGGPKVMHTHANTHTCSYASLLYIWAG